MINPRVSEFAKEHCSAKFDDDGGMDRALGVRIGVLAWPGRFTLVSAGRDPREMVAQAGVAQGELIVAFRSLS